MVLFNETCVCVHCMCYSYMLKVTAWIEIRLVMVKGNMDRCTDRVAYTPDAQGGVFEIAAAHGSSSRTTSEISHKTLSVNR